MYRRQVRRRRAVLLLLVAVSLTLFSLFFREGSSGGPLHGVQSVVATIFSPFEEVTGRALKPARDMINWFDETFDARGENERLRGQVGELRDELAQRQTELAQRKELGKLDALTGGGVVPSGQEPVTARVIGRSPTVWYATVTIDKGSSAGLAVDDPIVTGDGLAGRVSAVTRGTSQVTLITDPDSSVAARVFPGGSTEIPADAPTGVVEAAVGDPKDLQLNFVQRGPDINEGDTVVTAGFSVGNLASLFPPGIPIGEITDSSLEEQQAYQRVHLRAYADLRDMEFVQALVDAGKGDGG
ncbi:MAG: rod shape-determining protein MreC [Solirubrobacterales bacterium]|nr:rod shape-determining protein MreC [Solirubrobacterales bacterium]